VTGGRRGARAAREQRQTGLTGSRVIQKTPAGLSAAIADLRRALPPRSRGDEIFPLFTGSREPRVAIDLLLISRGSPLLGIDRASWAILRANRRKIKPSPSPGRASPMRDDRFSSIDRTDSRGCRIDPFDFEGRRDVCAMHGDVVNNGRAREVNRLLINNDRFAIRHVTTRRRRARVEGGGADAAAGLDFR